MNQNKPPLASFLQNKNRYDQGRYALLTVVILSLINLFSIVAIDRYYLFSSYVTKFLGVKGAIMYMDTGDVIFPILYGFVGFITVIPYFLCFLFSKKHVGWMIGALALFSIDSACFLSEFFLYVSVGELSTILDALVRVWVLVSLAMGVKYGLRVNKDEKEMEAVETSATPLDYNPEATVVITTHLIHDIEPILDEFAFMGEGGKIMLSGVADDVRAERGKSLDELFKEVFKCSANS